MSKVPPPPPIPEFNISDFHRPLDAPARGKIAGLLGRKVLLDDAAVELEYLIATYRAQVHPGVGATSTTVGSSIAAINEQLWANKVCVEKLSRFTNERCGVDAESFDTLNPHARAIRLAIDEFDRAADNRVAALLVHERVSPAAEALKYFCAMLHHFFRQHANPNWKVGPPARRRKFALEVLNEAEVERTDFISQPKRLDEYLDTFIPVQDLPPHWTWPGKRR
jgi:hypothetical protein